jgi:hypothetical protein
MVGGTFQVSNSPTFSSGVVDLYTITTAPSSSGATTVKLPATAQQYRYVRYLAPAGSFGNVAEMSYSGF